MIAGKPPDTLIEPHKPEHDHAKTGVDQNRVVIGFQVVGLDSAEPTVEADPQCRKGGDGHSQKVIGDQQERHDFPVLDFLFL